MLLLIIIIISLSVIWIINVAIISQIKNLNHNLYFVFKANWMIWDISEDSILFTKLDKNVKNCNTR